MATLALFVALSGSAYAVSQINGSQIQDRSIPGRKLKIHAISQREISRRLSVAYAESAGHAAPAMLRWLRMLRSCW